MPEHTAEANKRIPVTVLTGFLGSGKTTLLNRALRSPGMSETVVIVNEFGEIGLDHLLVEAPQDETVLLDNGCLCCSVLGDMVVTLGRLLERRDCGRIAPFKRIVIETSGLADPSPLLQTLVSEAALSDRLTLAGVVAVADAVNGRHALRHHFESLKQVVAADRIVLTKTDLASSHEQARMRRALKRLNPGADIVDSGLERQDWSRLVADPETSAAWSNWVRDADARASSPGEDHSHGHGRRFQGHESERIRTISVSRDEPASRDGLRLWLNALSRFKGPKLLRVKGIVNVEGAPYAVNAVQRIFHEPVSLDNWPTNERSTRIVFIANGLQEADLAATTDALGFRKSQLPKIKGLDFATADYQRFVAALSGFSVPQRL